MVSEHASPLAVLGGVDAGGQNVHVAELSARLAAHGHDVTVYTRRTNRRQRERVADDRGFHVVHVPAGPPAALPKDDLYPHMGEFSQWLLDEWSAAPPDLAHAHFWMSGLAALLAAKEIGLPVVQTFHALGVVKRRYQGAADTSPPERTTVERTIGRRADAVLATCSDEVFELARLGVPREKMSIVPCGVNLDEFGPLGPVAERGARYRLLAVGRLVPRKGFDVTIRALQGLPNTELVIAGGAPADKLAADPEAVRLRGVAEQFGVAQRVRLLGEVGRADMPALLRSADLVVCTPRYEPFGIVPLEAMACGVPVVATAVGGLTDTVVDGVTGVHVPPEHPRALRGVIRALLADECRRNAMSTAGQDRARSRYSWERVAAETIRAYDRALGAGGGRLSVASLGRGVEEA
jgi:glycosyltransferase involved in cell wall biosynthesis